MALRVYLTDSDLPSQAVEQEILARAGIELRVLQTRDPAEIAARAADADGLLVQYAPIDQRVLAALPHLKVIGRYGIGVDSVDVAAATNQGVYVCNCPDYCLDEVADHALALLLAAARRLFPLRQEAAAGGWSLAPGKPMPPLRGSTLGIAGLGRIGREVVARAKPFGFRLIGYDPFVSASAGAALGVEMVGFDELLGRADYLTLHLPLTAETRHVMNAGTLAQMKPGAWLINTARGGLVDTNALVAALGNQLGGAAVDVLEQEPPPPDHPLRRLANVILTPHAAYYSDAALANLQERIAAEVARVLVGESPTTAVNHAAMQRRKEGTDR